MNQPPVDADGLLAELIRQRIPGGGPGLALLVLQDGAHRVQLVKGLARVTDGSELRPDSIFYVGSLAKQFVGACVALLERDGALSAHDPIARYIDDLPAWGAEVTLDHLVHHVSGLHDADRASHMGVPADGVPAWSSVPSPKWSPGPSSARMVSPLCTCTVPDSTTNSE